MSADALTKIPDADHASAITANQLTLVWVNDNVVDGGAVNIVALQSSSASIPNLHSTVLRACDHPLALAVECDTSDVTCVPFEGHHGVGVGGLNVIELDIVVTAGGKETLIGSDTKAIDLRVRVLDGARADSGQRLPEADQRAC